MDRMNRAQMKQALAEQGIAGEPAELILRATAPARHEARVAEARAVAEAFCGLAWPALLALDAIGVGGRFGLGGHATERAPGLRALGKGRKQACDGAAWTAAIRAAAMREAEGIVLAMDGEELQLILEMAGGEAVMPLRQSGGPLAVVGDLAPWWQAAAGLALLRAVAPEAAPARPDCDWVRFRGEATAWAALRERASVAIAMREATAHALRDIENLRMGYENVTPRTILETNPRAAVLAALATLERECREGNAVAAMREALAAAGD